MVICSEPGCTRTAESRGMCAKHYNRARTRGEFGGLPCTVPGCDGTVTAKGMCAKHWMANRRHPDRCLVGYCDQPRAEGGLCAGHQPGHQPDTTCRADGCDKPRANRGLCEAHYRADLAAIAARITCADCGWSAPLLPTADPWDIFDHHNHHRRRS